MIGAVATIVSIFVLIFGYPYVAYKLLKLKSYGFGLKEVAIQHWLFNFILLLMPVSLCIVHIQPIGEVFIASQFAYWLPVLIMRYWRIKFTYIDRIWVRSAYPLIYLVFFVSLFLYIELYRNVSA
jgi:hypothetical protein